MAPNIRNAETERLAAELAALTGESKSEAVRRAVEGRLRRLRHDQVGRPLAHELDEIALRCASLPVLDDREPEEILGYDDAGAALRRRGSTPFRLETVTDPEAGGSG